MAAARTFARARPPGSEALIVGANRGGADDLARELSADLGATFGLHRFSLTQLAARLAAPELAAAGLSSSTQLGAEAVAARAAFGAVQSDTLAYFRPVAGMPGFARALARTLGEIRQSGVQASSLRALYGAGGDLAELLDRFEQHFRSTSSADRAVLFAAAVRGLHGSGRAFAHVPTVLLDLTLESPSDCAFVRALVTQAPEVLATLPDGDEDAARWFRELGASEAPHGAVELADNNALHRLRTYLFKTTKPPDGLADDSVRFFSAPGEGRECVEIARAVLAEAENGVRFDRIAIVLRSPQTYASLLEHALERARIPAYFEPGTQRPDPTGRAFLALLSCAVERLSAKRFAEYLSLGQVPDLTPEGAPPPNRRVWVAPKDDVFGQLDLFSDEDQASEERRASDSGLQAPGSSSSSPKSEAGTQAGDGSLRAPWKWERLLVEAAVLGGKDRWVRRLDGLAEEYKVKLAEIESDEPDSPRAGGIVRDLLNLEHLRRFALPIVEDLDGWPRTATWGEWLERLERLAPMVLKAPSRVLRVLAELRPMGEIGPIGLDEVRDVLAERLSLLQDEPPVRRFGRVFVATPHQIRGRSFDIVFVVGLAERLFPQKPREDPMLLDQLRERLAAGLKLQRDRDRHERLQLLLAVGAARRRVYLSYPRLELSESRPRVPSFYALDVVRAISGAVPNFEHFQRQAEREMAASLAWPAPREPAAAIDAFEHDLASLRPLLSPAADASVKGHAHYLLRLNESLRRSVVMRWARWRSQWSPNDGLMRVTDATRDALAAHRLTARPYSLSALQHYASCPYRFLLSAVYRLDVREEPEPVQRMDPLTRGSLFHSVQAEFFRALARRGDRLPITRASVTDALVVLDQTIARVAEVYHERLAPAIERIWTDEVASIRNDLRAWVEHLATKSDGWEPWLFEFAFGLPGDPGRDARSRPEPVGIGGKYTLRGSIDLVERRAGRESARVTDHKTGRVRTKRGLVIGGGRALQPVLYSLVVEAATGVPVEEGRLFYCTAVGGFEDHRIPIDDLARRMGIEALEIVDRAVEQGQLAAAPDRGACQWCDFRPVCGPNEERRIARKIQKPLADLLALRNNP